MVSSMKRIAALLVLVLAAACSDSTGASANAHVGTYSLRTIDNQALPVTVDLGVAIAGGSMTLSSGGTYTVRLDILVGGTTSSDSNSGAYTRTGNTIMLDDETSLVFSGGNTLTFTDPGDGSVWVFRK